MTFLHRVASMISWLFGRSKKEQRLDDELQSFVDMAAAARMRDGASPAEARRLALIELGGIEQTKEQIRTGRHGASFDEAGQNVRYGLRMLARNPGFTAVIVLTLALGIGANTAIFSIVDSLLLRSLPVQDPSRLALLIEEAPGDQTVWTYPIWEQIHARHDAFAGAAAWAAVDFNLAEGGEMNMVRGLWTSGEFFDVLGVSAAIGRTFSASDDIRGGAAHGPVVVISHGFWQRHFGGAPDVVGRTLKLERIPFTVIGVTPPGFHGLTVGRTFDVAVPFGVEPLIRGKDSRLEIRNSWWVPVMIRLKPDQTIEQATAALRGFQPAIREATQIAGASRLEAESYLDKPLSLDADVASLSGLRGQYRQPLVVMLVVVGLVLLIACANVANLLLARATARGHEWSLRLALGASRARLARQVLTESVLLAALGAAAGLVLAQWGSRLLVQQLSNDVVTLDLSLNGTVLAFTVGVTVLTALIFGLAPALRVTRGVPMDALRDRGRGATGSVKARVAGGLVVAQVVLSLVLVVGAGLFLGTFTSLAGRSLGFDSDRVLLAQVSTRRADMPPEQRLETFARIREQVLAVPGVAGSGLSFIGPMGGRIWMRQVHVSGSATTNEPRNTAPEGVGSTDAPIPAMEPYTALNAVSPGWMSTFGLTVRTGRDIAEGDRAATQRVAVVNETFVRKFLPGQNPIGHSIQAVKDGAMPPREIVGVVSDAAYRDAREPMLPTVYVPLAQFDADASTLPPPDIVLGARASAGAPPDALRKAVADAVTAINPRLSVFFRPLAEQVRRTMAQERLLAMLSMFFGALALTMAAVGLYGVTSYSVGLRRSEIAVRLALGATRGGVMRLVLGRVATLVGIGAVMGLVTSLIAARAVGSLLFGLEPNDPATLATATGLLVLVGFAAGWLPAFRASRLDPAAALDRV